MPYLPTLNAIAETPLFTNTFGGYDHREVLQDGEMYDEQNISGKDYPSLSTRQLRGTTIAYYDSQTNDPVYEYDNPQGLLAKASLVTIDGGDVYFSGHKVDGLTLSTAANMLPKQVVSMGAYVCIFPDAVYFNSIYLSEYGHMGASWTQNASLTVCLCSSDGTAYAAQEYTVSASAPADPANGQLWVDTSGTPHTLKAYNSNTSEWVGVATTYVRIECPGIGTNFSRDDAVFISGIECPEAYEGTEIENQITALNECMTLYGVGENYLQIAGILDVAITMATGAVTVERRVPSLDYVVEANNRIWGCKYGMEDGKTLNEIHACALGDFKNWYQYIGLSTDSYTASCGTDGPFTGAGSLKGYPVFFKENVLHRVSGTMPATFQIETTACRGVQDGSWRSVQVVGENLLYKSRTDVMLYDGSLPVSVSSALGDIRYYNAAAGAYGDLYYISMQDESNAWHMFCFDSSRAVWHREDDLHALCFASLGDELYCIDAENKTLLALNGTEGTLEDAASLPWSMTLGKYGYDAERQKYLYKFVLRVHMTKGSLMECWVMYDNSGDWEKVSSLAGRNTISCNVPVIPRRCDTCQLKITGHGEIKLYSIGRTYRGGSANGHLY